MNPFLKKVLAAVAIKEGIEKVQEMRRPKPSLWSRLSPVAVVAALGGALFYLNKSGKLGSMLGGAKEATGSGSSNGSSSWGGTSTASSNGGTTGASTAPNPPSTTSV